MNECTLQIMQYLQSFTKVFLPVLMSNGVLYIIKTKQQKNKQKEKEPPKQKSKQNETNQIKTYTNQQT